MKFTALDVPNQYGSLYRSSNYDISHYTGGFGMFIAKIYTRAGKELTVFCGPNALNAAMQWCGERNGA